MPVVSIYQAQRGLAATAMVGVVALELGLRGTAKMTVTYEITAYKQGTGDAQVLSTPALLQVMQQATMDALEGNLPKGTITAGLRINLDHLIGMEIGATVHAEATLTRMEGRRLIFESEVTSGDDIVGIGRIIRVMIDEETFLTRLS